MSLLDEAREASKVARGCAVSRLDDDLRTEVEQALATDGVTCTGIERALAKRGIHLASKTLQVHVRGGCSCEPG